MAVTISSIAQAAFLFVASSLVLGQVYPFRGERLAIFGLLFRTFMDNSFETRRFVKPGSCEIRFVAIKLRERNLTT